MIIALSGGVGGAKLALGLSRIMPHKDLLVVVNTGDDFEHLGLSISPDIDTVAYTLAGLANRELGWGRHDETWSFMETMEALGGQTWFRLGDRDIALHVERTRRLKAGESLSAVTADLCRRMGVGPAVVPMTDDPVRTRLLTDLGWLDFQEYFVHLRCEPVVSQLQFQGAGAAKPHPRFIAALDSDPALQGKISYRCMKVRGGSEYYHLAAAADDQTIKTLQERAFFSRYREKSKLAAGGSVDVLPLELVAETKR